RTREARGGYRAAAPPHFGGGDQRGVRPPRRRDLERSARGGDAGHAGGRGQRPHQGAHMKARARKAPDLLPATLGLGALAAALAGQEIVIRLGPTNRFRVPLPSEIAPAFIRIILEEDVLGRFLTTAGEALAASLLLAGIGIPIGIVLHRVQVLRRA